MSFIKRNQCETFKHKKFENKFREMDFSKGRGFYQFRPLLSNMSPKMLIMIQLHMFFDSPKVMGTKWGHGGY